MSSIEQEHRAFELGYYATAFIDVLGQREALRKLGDIPDPPDEAAIAAFTGPVEETIERVVDFRKTFRQFFQNIRDAEVSIEGLNEDQREEIRKSRRFDLLTHSLGDALSMSVPLKIIEGPPLRPTNGILVLLLATSTAFMSALARGFAIRGGLEVGVGTVVGQEEVYGSNLVRSYDIESHLAQWPRIVIGPRLYHYVERQKNAPGSDPHSQITRGLATLARNLMYEERDGLMSLDYFGAGARETMDGNSADQLYPLALAWALGEQKRLFQEENLKLASRYSLLVSYLISRAPRPENEAA